MCPRGRPRGQGRPRRLHLCYFGKKIPNSRALGAPPPDSRNSPPPPYCRYLATRLSLIMFCNANFCSMPPELSLMPRFKSTNFYQISLN